MAVKVQKFSRLCRSAFPGVVHGVVRLVRNRLDFSKVLDGDVKVSTMTSPEYIAVIKKSVAIVTEEGGITSHAAIVARELKKPCIIGTKISTKVLKDGDVVEVDAERGVVKILKRAL